MPIISDITEVPLSSTVNTGGANFLSGVASGYNGPWAIETQSLTVTYVRVPGGMTFPTASGVTSLSATNTRTSNVLRTNLNCIIKAEYNVRKDYNSYSTSSHQQPQTFTIVSDNADPFGNTYGTYVASSNRYNLGPAGTVVTVQPYIRRVPWDDNIHSEVTKGCIGTNYLYAKYNGITPIDFVPATTSFEHFNLGIPPHYANSWNSCGGGSDSLGLFGSLGQDYNIMGAYARNKESDAMFTGFLNLVGVNIQYSSLFKYELNPGVDYNQGSLVGLTSNPLTYLDSNIRTGFSEYRSSRHQY